MSDQSFRENFLARLRQMRTESKIRSRQLFQQLWQDNETGSTSNAEDSNLHFLEENHALLFPQQSFLEPSDATNLFPLKTRTVELILRQINLFYLPQRLENLLSYCDPFTAVATFLNALNFSYEDLLKNQHQQKLCQSIFREFMEIEQGYKLESVAINDLPLYEAAATHDLENFHQTAFAFKRALDVIDILEQVQPRNYQKQQNQLRQFWHQKQVKELEKMIEKLNA